MDVPVNNRYFVLYPVFAYLADLDLLKFHQHSGPSAYSLAHQWYLDTPYHRSLQCSRYV
jgi:hypothetical protein